MLVAEEQEEHFAITALRKRIKYAIHEVINVLALGPDLTLKNIKELASWPKHCGVYMVYI